MFGNPKAAVARQGGLAEARWQADGRWVWLLGRSRWHVGQSGSPFAQRLQPSCGVGKLGSLPDVSCWGCCLPLGTGIRHRARDIGPHDLPLSGRLLAHDIRVLMIISLQPLSFRVGLFTPPARSIPRLRGLSERVGVREQRKSGWPGRPS